MDRSTTGAQEDGRQDGRRHRRYIFSEIVLLTRADSFPTVPARAHNISTGGLGVATDKQLAVGMSVSAWISSARTAGLLRCDAVVRYRHGERHGLEFCGLTPQQADIVDRICQSSLGDEADEV